MAKHLSPEAKAHRSAECDEAAYLRSSGRRMRSPFVFYTRMNGNLSDTEKRLITTGRVGGLHEPKFSKYVPEGMILTSALNRPSSQQPILMTTILATGLALWADHLLGALERDHDFCECFLPVEAFTLPSSGCEKKPNSSLLTPVVPVHSVSPSRHLAFRCLAQGSEWTAPDWTVKQEPPC